MKKLFFVFPIVVFLAAGCNLTQPNTQTGSISAKVTSVIDRPNRAEDGYYGIQAEEIATGKKITINATGYLNTPIQPQDRGEACVYVPKVTTGQLIDFKLPASPTESGIFNVCYKNSDSLASQYFFKIK